MLNNLDSFQQVNKDAMETAMQSFSAFTKGMQAISAEVADYSRKSFDQGSAVMEKFSSAKSLDQVIEVQSDFARSSYEDLVSQMTKFGEMYADLAKGAYKPFESQLSKK